MPLSPYAREIDTPTEPSSPFGEPLKAEIEIRNYLPQDECYSCYVAVEGVLNGGMVTGLACGPTTIELTVASGRMSTIPVVVPWDQMYPVLSEDYFIRLFVVVERLSDHWLWLEQATIVVEGLPVECEVTHGRLGEPIDLVVTITNPPKHDLAAGRVILMGNSGLLIDGMRDEEVDTAPLKAGESLTITRSLLADRAGPQYVAVKCLIPGAPFRDTFVEFEIKPPCPACAADYNGDGLITEDDVRTFAADFEDAIDCADIDGDGAFGSSDVAMFFDLYEAAGR